MSRSRSNIFDTARHAATSTTARANAITIATVTVGLKTWSDMSKGNTSAGRLASVPSCWATRTSEDRTEIAVPTHTDHAANSGAKRNSAKNHERSEEHTSELQSLRHLVC